MKPVLDTERLRQIREEKGWSKKHTAEEMGILQDVYLRYENGVRLPSYSVIKNMALTLGTSVEYLSGKTDDKMPMDFIVHSHEKGLSYVIESYQKLSPTNKNRIQEYVRKVLEEQSIQNEGL